MQDPICMDNKEFLAMVDLVEQQCLEELYGMDWCDPTCYAIEILDAKYDAVSIEDVVKEDTHLSQEERADLKVVLSKFQKLFSGKLGVFPHQRFHIKLEPGARPKHAYTYAIPHIHLTAFKKELEHLVKLWSKPKIRLFHKSTFSRVTNPQNLRICEKVTLKNLYI